MAQPFNNSNKSKSSKAGNKVATNLPFPHLAVPTPKSEVVVKTEIDLENSPQIAPARKVANSTAAVIDFIAHSIAQTQKAGEHLGWLLEAGDVILLEGELGAGKTTLTKGIAKGLEVEGYVNSPTFTLVNEYKGRLPVYHLDCYRLESAAEALDIGIEEYLYSEGVTLIEWPQRIAAVLPAEHLRIKLNYLADTKRSLRMEPVGARYIQLVANFKKTAFGA